jgi:hypothetical protein
MGCSTSTVSEGPLSQLVGVRRVLYAVAAFDSDWPPLGRSIDVSDSSECLLDWEKGAESFDGPATVWTLRVGRRAFL